MTKHYHRWHLAHTGGAYFRNPKMYRTPQAARQANPPTWQTIVDDRKTVKTLMVLACEGECKDKF